MRPLKVSSCPRLESWDGKPLQSPIRGKAERRSYIRSFKFTGPDGIEYRWALGVTGMKIPRVSLLIAPKIPSALNRTFQLVTTDENKTVIAQFHRALHFPKKQRARLEVQPEGMNMLDYIVLTFVFVEDERREREKRARGGNGY